MTLRPFDPIIQESSLSTQESEGENFACQRREEIDEHLSESAAKIAEVAGLIKSTDQFSWK